MHTTELETIIKNTQGLNFVGSCGSLLQINGINSTIMYLNSIGIKLKGVVIIQESETFKKGDYSKKYFIDDKNIEFINGSILFGDLDENERIENWMAFIKHLFNEDQKNLETIYIASDSFSFHWINTINKNCGRKEIVYCEFDDGIVNYRAHLFDDLIWRIHGVSILKIPNIFLRYSLKYFGQKTLMKMMVKKNLVIDCKTMQEKGGKLTLNDRVSNYWVLSFMKNAELFDYSKIKIIENNILILGSYDDQGVFRFVEKYIKTIVRCAKEKGKNVIFKTHPRDCDTDRYKKLGCLLLEERYIAAEEIFSILKIKPACVIGYGTTALVTGSVVFHIPSISFTSIIRGMDFYSRYVSDSFKQRFGDVVFCPNNKKELVNNIESLI